MQNIFKKSKKISNSALSAGSLLEIHGTGINEQEGIGLNSIPPARTSGTFYMTASIPSPLFETNGEMRQTAEGNGREPLHGRARMACEVQVSEGWMFRKHFVNRAGAEENTLSAAYRMDSVCRGSYSITLVRFIDREAAGYGSGHYAEAYFTRGDTAVAVGCRFSD